MPLTPEHQAKLLADSKDAAAAFLEDMQHLREIIAKPPPKRSELRRMSGVIRRLLIDGDLKRVAAPRVSPLLLKEPNNKHVYGQLGHEPKGFFGSAGINLGGLRIGGLLVVFGTLPAAPPPSDHSDGTVEVRVDNFLSQRVLYLSGHWATRRSVIKYVANIASGVHSGGAETDEEKLIEAIRRTIFYVFTTTGIAVRFRSNAFTLNPAEFHYDECEVDPSLIELHAAAYFLTLSPAVEKLERIVTSEIRQSV